MEVLELVIYPLLLHLQSLLKMLKRLTGIIVISSILTIKMSYMVPEMENTMDLALITRTRITLLLK